MLFRQLFDRESSTYTYLIADEKTREAVLIDTVAEQSDRDLGLINELDLKLIYLLETHVHADHVTASGPIRAKTGARIAYSARAGVEGADVPLEDGDVLKIGDIEIEARLTPGHTSGDVTFVLAQHSMAFTGDTLLIRGCGRTDFQQGSPNDLFASVKEKIFSLPEDTLLYPGHDYKGRTVTTVGEERKHNLRLRDNITEDQFVEIMSNLNLAYPKKIDVAVPENQQLGLGYSADTDAEPARTCAGSERVSATAGERSTKGVPEVSCAWVAANAAKYKLVDVREDNEVRGGMIDGALHIPLATVVLAAKDWSTDEPLVVYCRSGGRSGRAAQELEKMGFDVVSMRGGTLSWIEGGHKLVKRAA